MIHQATLVSLTFSALFLLKEKSFVVLDEDVLKVAPAKEQMKAGTSSFPSMDLVSLVSAFEDLRFLPVKPSKRRMI